MCVSLTVCLSVSEHNSNQNNVDLDAGFDNWLFILHWRGLYWNWWPWVKGQGYSDAILFFLHNSLLTSLLWISALLWSTWNLVCCLYMPIVDWSLNVIKIEWVMTSLWSIWTTFNDTPFWRKKSQSPPFTLFYAWFNYMTSLTLFCINSAYSFFSCPAYCYFHMTQFSDHLACTRFPLVKPIRLASTPDCL